MTLSTLSILKKFEHDEITRYQFLNAIQSYKFQNETLDKLVRSLEYPIRHVFSLKVYTMLDALLLRLNNHYPEILKKVLTLMAKKSTFCIKLLDLLAFAGNTEALNTVFIYINQAILDRDIAPTIYSDILSNRKGTALLNIAYSPRHTGTTSHIVLSHAYYAYRNKWLSKDQYKEFLIKHPQYKQGFSYLHQALLSDERTNTLVYVQYCLMAICDGVLTLEEFRQQLLHKNHCNYPVFHQAINNKFLENAELILNLFHYLMPQNQFASSISYRAVSSNTAWAWTQEPQCNNDQPEHLSINDITMKTRGALVNNSIIDAPILYKDPNRQIIPELDRVLALIQQVALEVDMYVTQTNESLRQYYNLFRLFPAGSKSEKGAPSERMACFKAFA